MKFINQNQQYKSNINQFTRIIQHLTQHYLFNLLIMIKKITKLLHPKLITQKQIVYLNADRPDDKDDLLDGQTIEEAKAEYENTKLQQTIKQEDQEELVQAGQETHGHRDAKKRKSEVDDYQNLSLYDSNWELLSRFVNMEHSFQKKGKVYKDRVNQQLSKFESFVKFDIMNLSKLHINQLSEFNIKKSLLRTNPEYRYLETDAEQGLPLESALISRTKLIDLISNKNQVALRKMFKNGQLTNRLGLYYEDMLTIIETVIESQFKNSFLLNFLNYNQFIAKNKKGKHNPPKSVQKIWQRLDLLVDVNKLRTLWATYKLFVQEPTHPHEKAISNAIISQLPKIGFKGVDPLQSQKQVRSILSIKVKNSILNRLLKHSLQTFVQYNDFVTCWGLSILLFSKLFSFNGIQNNISSLSLAKQFTLFQNNLKQSYEEILFNIIPQQLNKANQKIILEVYRFNLKNWRGTRTIEFQKDQHQKKNIFQNLVSQSLQSDKPIQIVYTSWKHSFPQKVQSKIYPTQKRSQKYSTVLSEEQMIKNLVKGDYSSVLNYFLLTFNPSFDKVTYTQIKKFIIQSKQYEFQDENAKAYFILSKISDLLSYQAKPISLQPKYFQKFKEIRWLNSRQDFQQKRKQQRNQSGKLFSSPKKKQKRGDEQSFPIEDEDKPYSRKGEKNLYENPVSAQRIYRKPKLFNKSQQKFSTYTPTGTNKIDEKVSSQLKDSYSEYKSAVKQITNQTSTLEFSFNEYKDLKSIQQYAEKKSSQINQFNYKFLIDKNNIPIVGQGNNLLKYLFLKGKGEVKQVSSQFQKIKNRLKVSFVSQIGGLEKDYSQYLKDCRFMFPLSDKIYTDLLMDQGINYSRKNFKIIVSHMIAFKSSINDDQVTLISEICRKNKTGITLIEIYYLFINNKIQISVPSIYKICQALQRFNKINDDVFPLTKRYCESLKIPFQINMMTSYCKSMLQQQEGQPKLIEFCQILKDELKPKPYKVRTDLTAQQNLKVEKQYKEASKISYIKTLYQIIHMVVSSVDKKLPAFISEYFDQYEKLKPNLQPHQIAISLMIYSANMTKYLQIIDSLRKNHKNIVVDAYDWTIKAMILYPKQFQQYIQSIFEVVLFTHNFILNQAQVLKTAQLFKILKGPSVYSRFLSFIIRYQIPVNYQIKNLFYYAMNNSSDDFSKSSINQLLDFIFNPNREKQKQQFRLQKIEEQEKSKLILEIQNRSKNKKEKEKEKQIKLQENLDKQKKQKGSPDPKKGSANTPNTTNANANSATTSANNLNKTDNKNLQTENKPTQEKEEPQGKKIQMKSKKQTAKQTKSKTEKKGSKEQRKKSAGKVRQGLIGQAGQEPQKHDDILKANILPKKLQSKTLTNFTDIFGAKEPIEETDKAGMKGKGGSTGSKKDETSTKDGKNEAKTSSYNPSKAGKKK